MCCDTLDRRKRGTDVVNGVSLDRSLDVKHTDGVFAPSNNGMAGSLDRRWRRDSAS